MGILKFIFIITAIFNIALLIKKWVDYEDDQYSAIAGWFCAILYCLSSTY